MPFPENEAIKMVGLDEKISAPKDDHHEYCLVRLWRSEMELTLNRLVRDGEISAPIVIGRDHLQMLVQLLVLTVNRKYEDGSDAVGDWAVLNALINTAAGGSWI
ncbi:hypothetical protein ACVNP0_07730 [Staphylococcus aureus]